MLDFQKLFETSFKIREVETGRVLDCVKMDAPFESACPDKFSLVDREKLVEEKIEVFDERTKEVKEKLVPKMVSFKAKVFDAGDFHGGNIRGNKGDYILFDGAGFFAVPEKDRRGVPVFEKRFVKL